LKLPQNISVLKKKKVFQSKNAVAIKLTWISLSSVYVVDFIYAT